MPTPLEDIFNELDPDDGADSSPRSSTPPTPQSPQVKMSESPQPDVMTEGGGSLSPHERQRPSAPPPPLPPAPLDPENPARRSTTIRISNRVLLWGAFVLLLLLLFGVVVWMFTGVLRQSVSNENTTDNTNIASNTNIPAITTNASNINANAPSANLSPQDADRDGLSAEEEARLGTNPNDSDSDHDSLSDLMETTHQTNPMNPDTDNDGYLDGLEIRAGYNPRGPGRLDLSTFLQNES